MHDGTVPAPGEEMTALLPHLGGGYRLIEQAKTELDCLEVIPPPRFAEGSYELHRLRDGIIVGARRHFSYRDWHLVDYGVGRYSVQIQLEGRRRVRAEAFDCELAGPRLSVLYQPLGTPKRTEWQAGCLERTLTLSLPVDGVRAIAGVPLAIVEIMERLSGAPARHAFRVDLPLDELTATTAGAIFEPPVSERVAADYRAARAIELLCIVHDRLGEAMGIGAIRKPSTEARLVLRIRAVLEDIFPALPNERDIAALMRVPASMLRAEFRRAEGMTMIAYQREARMRRASDLLEETDMCLKEIAHHVGYQHQSNFCTAFLRWAGLTAGELRRRARNDRA